VGKSFFSCILALYYARKGEKILLTDLDLGGCNLHTWLGISPFTSAGLDEIFTERRPMGELIQSTFEPGLFFLQGPIQHLSAPNLKYSQKRGLLKGLRKLSFPRIIADLGAGTHYNVIDFFLLGSLGIVVVTPERTSIENAYRFLKVALIRRLFPSGEGKGDPELEKKVARLIAEARTVEILRTPEGRAWYLSRMEGVRIGVVVNQVAGGEGRKLGEGIAQAITQRFFLPVLYLGSLPYLAGMRRVLNESPLPLRELFTLPELQDAISTIAEGIDRFLLGDLAEGSSQWTEQDKDGLLL